MLGSSGSRAFRSDQSCLPARQAILLHMSGSYPRIIDSLMCHRYSIGVCAILNYLTRPPKKRRSYLNAVYK